MVITRQEWFSRKKPKRLKVEVEVIANLVSINPFDFFVEEYAENYPFQYRDQLPKELVPYLEIKERRPTLMQWLEGILIKAKKPSMIFWFTSTRN